MTGRVTVTVDPVVLLYAVRYGLGRATGAHGDAVELVREYWPLLAGWRGSILTDLRHTANVTGFGDVRDSCTDLIDWIGQQP